METENITFTLWGPATLKDKAAIEKAAPYGLLLELTAFRPKVITEAEALKLRQKYPALQFYGCFDGSPENQLLYFLDKHLIDGAVCRNIPEKVRQRVRETTGAPVFTYIERFRREDIESLNHAIDDGFFFAAAPTPSLLPKLTKPCIYPGKNPAAYILFCPERNNK